ALRGEEFVSQGIVDDADDYAALVFERDGDAEGRVAVRVVRRAVERVNYPLVLALLTLDCDYVARLLAQYRVARVVASDALDDEALGGEVCLRDEVYVALVRDLNRAPELLCEHAPGVARGLDGEVKHRKGVDSRQHKDSCFPTDY